MGLAVARTRALDGLEAPPVTVEVHLANGLPSFTLVGLPDTEVREARDRVRAALATCGFEFPNRRITVNLAPADLPKESGRYDLPIALGILAASGQIDPARLRDCEFVGELSLSGLLRPVRGALAMALRATRDGARFVVPEDNAEEAALSGHPGILPCTGLLDVVAWLRGEKQISPFLAVDRQIRHDAPDLADVRGQGPAKRALEIAAAGGHSLLFSGPPGCGKSMLAARLPGLLPPLEEAAALTSAATLSLASQFRPERFGEPPYRAPHHTASTVALIGGGNPPRPGEISLAHAGILFLDELPLLLS